MRSKESNRSDAPRGVSYACEKYVTISGAVAKSSLVDFNHEVSLYHVFVVNKDYFFLITVTPLPLVELAGLCKLEVRG